MEDPTTAQKWGMAAILGCGACCGGLVGNAAWMAGMVGVAGGLVASWLWGLLAGGLVLGLVVLHRRRHRAACPAPHDSR
jgi:hypothetical protein